MAQCVVVVENQIYASNTNCDFQLLTANEISELQAHNTTNLIQLLNEYFTFDGDVFGQLMTTSLVLFITGLAAGFIYKKLSN